MQTLTIILTIGILSHLICLVLLPRWLPDPELSVLRDAALLHPITTTKNEATRLDDRSQPQQPHQLQPQQSQPQQLFIDPSNNNDNNDTVWLAGIILDATKIRNNIWQTILDLNCNYNVNIHIISKENSHVARKNYDDMIVERYQRQKEEGEDGSSSSGKSSDSSCASIEIISQSEALDELDFPIITDEELSYVTNRIDRISILRDVQRMLLHNKYSNNLSVQNKNDSLLSFDTRRARGDSHDYNGDGNNGGSNHGVVILADLDLFELPKVDLLMDQAHQLLMAQQNKGESQLQQKHQQSQSPQSSSSSYPHDAICASGVTMNLSKNKKQQKSYYDTFATVFYPDTFSHPLKRRLTSNNYYPNENPNLVRSNHNQNGNFTQRHMYNYIKEEGKKSDTGNVRVTSCFGGLAMYKANVYFQSKCRYRLDRDYVNALLVEEAVVVNRQQDIDGGDVNKNNNSNDNNLLRQGAGGYNNSAITTNITMTMTTTAKKKSIMRYASIQEKRPCEHVVFHDCLKRGGGDGGDFDIAINPKLVSFWKKD